MLPLKIVSHSVSARETARELLSEQATVKCGHEEVEFKDLHTAVGLYASDWVLLMFGRIAMLFVL